MWLKRWRRHTPRSEPEWLYGAVRAQRGNVQSVFKYILSGFNFAAMPCKVCEAGVYFMAVFSREMDCSETEPLATQRGVRVTGSSPCFDATGYRRPSRWIWLMAPVCEQGLPGAQSHLLVCALDMATSVLREQSWLVARETAQPRRWAYRESTNPA